MFFRAVVVIAFVLIAKTSFAQTSKEWKAYQSRQKSILEQVLNYTTTGNENGDWATFWISGFDGQHKCVVAWFMSVNDGTHRRQTIDIRQFNPNSFATRRMDTLQLIGDEKQAVMVEDRVSPDRLKKAWSLAFRECPPAPSKSPF